MVEFRLEGVRSKWKTEEAVKTDHPFRNSDFGDKRKHQVSFNF